MNWMIVKNIGNLNEKSVLYIPQKITQKNLKTLQFIHKEQQSILKVYPNPYPTEPRQHPEISHQQILNNHSHRLTIRQRFFGCPLNDQSRRSSCWRV